MNAIALHQQHAPTVALDPYRPTNMDQAMKLAELIARSDLAPKDYRGKAGNVFVAMQMGHELGLSPMQAVQNIAVINGRPSVWGDALLALCQAHPSFVDLIETDDGSTATATLKRQGRADITRTFSMDDAKRAGLLGKQGPWTGYPKRMRQMRARGFALRDGMADVLRGLSSAEEQEDIGRAEVVEVRTEGEAVDTRTEPKTKAAVKVGRKNKRDQGYTGDAVIEDIRTDIENACDVLSLKLAASRAKPLPESEAKQALRDLYNAKLEMLERDGPIDPKTGEMLNDASEQKLPAWSGGPHDAQPGDDAYLDSIPPMEGVEHEQ